MFLHRTAPGSCICLCRCQESPNDTTKLFKGKLAGPHAPGRKRGPAQSLIALREYSRLYRTPQKKSKSSLPKMRAIRSITAANLTREVANDRTQDARPIPIMVVLSIFLYNLCLMRLFYLRHDPRGCYNADCAPLSTTRPALTKNGSRGRSLSTNK